MKLNSVRFKIVILYVSLLGAILIIYSCMLYFSLHYILYDELDDELEVKAQEISNTINSYLSVIGDDRRSFVFAVNRAINLEGEHENQHKIKKLEREWLQKIDKFDLKEDYVSFLNLDDKSVINSSNFPKELSSIFTKDIKKIKDETPILRNIEFQKNELRVISMSFYYKEQKQYIIQVATSLKPIIHILQNRLFNIAVSIPIILLFAGFIGQLFAIRILKPVMEITRTAKNITYENLNTRVNTENIDEEMRYLADAFNDMISRLERSFKYIAEFSSNVAHELKTPIAIVRGESEVALRKERNTEEYKRIIVVNLEETKKMLKIIEDLLLLTKLDYRPGIFKFEKFDLIEFLNEIYEQSKLLTFQKDIKISISMPNKPVIINGNKLHLRRLFFNLLDNAIKFTARNGRIDISMVCENRTISISISDTGIGIAEEDLPKVFDKFFHRDRINREAELGSGLGLSIVQSIAKIHHGNVKIKSTFGQGSTFTLTLPLP